jgi:hypothetical protein
VARRISTLIARAFGPTPIALTGSGIASYGVGMAWQPGGVILFGMTLVGLSVLRAWLASRG